MLGFIGWIIVGGLAGWLASIVMGTNRRQGCIIDILLGIVGGLVGGFLLSLVGLRGNAGFFSSLVTAFIGAVVILAAARALRT
ncbi:MAG: GlsB/YeaQ/YmgE family stress response membrane protein [Ardenticatenaceae bacterium]|nr:GlsB/YeaQ/YmgE family stress response membrane protein [Ardenticatenaceae bacterium]